MSAFGSRNSLSHLITRAAVIDSCIDMRNVEGRDSFEPCAPAPSHA